MMLPIGGDTETLQNHVMVYVVYGVPDEYVMEKTEVCPENIVRL